MKTTAEILDILRDFKAHYAEKYGIITLGLFGSAARGEHCLLYTSPSPRDTR